MREVHFVGCPSGSRVLSLALPEALFTELLGYELNVEAKAGILDVLHELMDLLEPRGTRGCRDPLDAVIHAYKINVQEGGGDWCHCMSTFQLLPTVTRRIARMSSIL
jgi:hypothetical protein